MAKPKQAFVVEKTALPVCGGCSQCGDLDDRHLYILGHDKKYYCKVCFIRIAVNWPKPGASRRIEGAIKLVPERVAHLKALADARNQQKRGFKSSKYWSEDPHFLGLVGESVVAELLGMDVDESLRVSGDGGLDFVLRGDGLLPELSGKSANVKTSTYWSDPHLKLADHEKKAQVYFLCAFNKDTMEARYIGWATDDELRSKGSIQNYGYGARTVLRANDLHKEVFLDGQDRVQAVHGDDQVRDGND